VSGRTRLPSAHRLSTLQAADRLWCWRRGRSSRRAGTRSWSSKEGGVYAKLHKTQNGVLSVSGGRWRGDVDFAPLPSVA
jgi:ABC-type multidrug transport system fused ATPase/permease subunit